MLNELNKQNINIITINQDGTIKNISYVTIMFDTTNLTAPIIDMVNSIRKLDKVKDTALTAFE